MAQCGKNCLQGRDVGSISGHTKIPLGAMATHSSILLKTHVRGAWWAASPGVT